MPNYVRNIIRFEQDAPQERIEELFRSVIRSAPGKNGGDAEEPYFDFNALVPMPEELNIESGSDNDVGMLLCRLCEAAKETAVRPAQDIPGRYRLPGVANYVSDRLIAYMEQSGISPGSPDALSAFVRTEKGKSLYGLGQHSIDNLRRYGAMTWYEWHREHWGTKWNSYGSHADMASRTVSFSTARSCPFPIAEALAEKFPDIGFDWIYADGDTGCNAGRISCSDGNLHIRLFENLSNEAYAAYVECWGGSDCLYLDESGIWRRYDCDTCPHQC